MTRKHRQGLLGFAALGLGAALTSTYVHYQLLTNPAYTSFCDVSSTVSCTQAYLSSYGSIWGVPVAVGGVMYFGLVLAIVGLAGNTASKSRENVPGYVFALSTIALAFILYLGWASYVVLKTFCLLCSITYVSVIAIFLISGGATPFPMKTLPNRARRDIPTLVSSPLALVIVILFAAAAVMASTVFPREGATAAQSSTPVPLPTVTDDERAKLAQWWEVQPKVEVPLPADGAKVLIVKFNDYQCPACKVTFDQYKQILPKYIASGQVKYVVKQYPLEPECNPYVPNVVHNASCEAAASVIMARSKGTADKLEDWIFSHQGPPLLTPEQVKDAARSIGGITDFDAQYARAKEEIKTDAGLGQLLNVKSTPTFYINGRSPTQILPAQYFEVLIQLELQRTK
jgi:uncharacterized membrane protein/protein-disulfide isomerase